MSNEASHLEHFAPIVIFSYIYSIELELHDRKVCFAHLCLSFTRIDLSFLENPRSNWVVIIGLEFLSLTCPGLGLGSEYVHQLCLCHPVIMMVILILLVWRIGFGVTGLELASVRPTVQGCCLVR
jgi:hypothetical protein